MRIISYLLPCLLTWSSLLRAQPLINTLTGHSGAVNSIAVSPDGDCLVSGGKDETIRIWDLKSGQLRKTISTSGSSVKRVSFRPDGKAFLAGLYCRFAEVDLNSYKMRYSQKKAHSSFVETCIYSADADYILTSSWRDKTLVAWKARGFKKQVETQEVTWVDNAIFNSNNSLILSGGHDNMVKIWDFSTGSLVKSMAGHDDWVYDLCLSADEKTLYSGSFDRTIKIWDLNTNKNIATLKGHHEGIVCLDLSADGKYLASGGMDSTVVIWDLATRKELSRLTGHEGPVMDVKFSPDGKRIYSCSIDKTI